MMRLLVIIAVGMLAGQVQAGLAMRGLAAIRANMSTAPTDYDHYWHPSRYLDSDDHAGSLDGTTYGGLTEGTNGWDMGTSDTKYVVLDGPISNGTSYTISAWIKPDISAMNVNQYGGWIVSDRGTLSEMDFQLIYDRGSVWGNVAMTVNVASNNAFVGITTNNAYINNTWQHLCGVVDGTTSQVWCYINGVAQVASGLTGKPSNVSTNSATFGTASWSPTAAATKYHGSMDNVKIWDDRALTTDEVKSLYNIGRTK